MSENECEKVIAPDGTEEKIIFVPGSGTNKRGVSVLAKLEPYLHLLPDLSRVDLKEQQKLYQALFSVGVSAAVSLHKLLHEAPAATKAKTVSEFDKAPCATIDLQETFRHLTRIGALDEAAESMRKSSTDESSSKPSGEMDRELANLVTDDVAAAALSAFVTATGRRPPTRHVENLMAASQDAVTSTDEEGSTPPNYKDFDSHGKGKNHQDNLDDEEDEDEEDLEDIDEDEDEEDEDLEDDSDSLLRFSCASGYSDLCRLVVTMRQSTDYFGSSDSTPLQEACAAGHVEVVNVLLEAGADVNAISASQNTALHYASAGGHLECVKALLDTGKCDLEIKNENGRDSLMEAANAGRLPIVQMLVEHGANPNSVTDSVDFKVGLESCLTLASFKGHVDVVEYLLKIMDPSVEHSEELHTALMEAAMDGHTETARLLLKAGAPVNLPSDSFECPLTLAACGGHTDLVNLLIEYGADLEEPNDEGYTPLMEAAREGHLDIVRTLLDRGANVNAKTDEGVETALGLAACGGFKNVVQLLVERGGDLSIGDRTPLFEASQEGHVDVVVYIVQQLRRQADNAADVLKDLNNSLLAAAETGNINICNILLENGAQVDSYGKDGKTSLMESSKQGNLLMIEFLIHKGADVNRISSNQDATALSLACLNGHADAVKYLLEHGGNPHLILKDNVTCLLEASRNGHTPIVELILDYNSPAERQQLKDTKVPPFPTTGVATKRNASTNICPTALGSNTNTTSTATSTLAPTMNAQQGVPDPTKMPAGLPKSARPKAKPVSKLKDVASNSLHQSTGCCTHHPPQNQAQQNAYAAAAAAMAMPNFPVVQDPSEPPPPAPFGLNALAMGNQPFNQPLPMPMPGAPLFTGSGPNQQFDSSTPNASQLFAAMAAAAASASCNGSDDWLFAQFIQRSLLTSKKREAMSEEDLRHFTEMVQQQFRSIFPSGQVDPAAFVSAAGQQALSNICAAAALAEAQQGVYNNFEGAKAVNQVQDPTPKTTDPPSPPNVACCDKTKTKPNTTNSSTTTTTAIKAAADSTTGNIPLPPTTKRKSASFSTKEEKLTFLKNRGIDTSNFGNNANLNDLKKQSAAFKKQVAETDELIRTKIDALTIEAETLKKMSANAPPSDVFPNSVLEKAVSKLNEIGTLQEAIDSVTANNEALKNIVEAQQQNQHMQPQPRTARRVPAVPNPNMPHPKCAHHTSDKCPQHGSHNAKNAIAHKNASAKRSASQAAPTTDIVDLETENNNDTPLTLACVGGHSSAVELLIKRGADVEHRDKKGFTPLILAATGGHTEVCKILLENGCKVDAQSERTKDTALSLACSGGRKEVVDLLLKANANIEHRNVSDYTPLSLAASGGYVDIINMLLNAGAEINSRTGSKLGISPLMLAAMNGHEAATQLLLERGSDINAQIETNRNTALTLACFQGRTEVVKLLLNYNANVEHRAKTGLTPLMEAANGNNNNNKTDAKGLGGYVDVGNLLLDAGADPNAAPVPTSRDTALTIAADKGHAAFVELLIHNGAMINVRNKKGCSALWLACNGGHLETVQTLVKHNADVDIHDNRKVTPLIAAFRKGHLKVIKYMVRHVSQFPGDNECQRFISTLTDKDLIAKCNQCMEIIHSAKAKQAEEANKAAQLLLEQLAQEEALAESKKQSKKRQKEKKKAKKLAKKTQNTPENDEDPPEPTQEEPEKDVDEKPAQPVEPEKPKTPKIKPVEKVEPEEDEDEPKIPAKPIKVERQEEEARVPVLEVITPETEVANELLSPGSNYSHSQLMASPVSKTSKAGIRPSRRTRHESGKGTTTTHQARNNIANNGTSKNMIASHDEEWLHASKKRPTSNKSSRVDRKGAPTVTSKDYVYISAEGTTNRGRLQVLHVAAANIARVIGRGGSNINAIRESTLAHIEVEKMAIRREQAFRTITIKGNPDAVRQAVSMIDLLISEIETPVAEIIERIQNASNFPVDSNSGTVSPSTVQQVQPSQPVVVGSTLSTKEPSAAKTTPSQAPNVASAQNSNVNVWAQRAAKLQQQKIKPDFKVVDPVHKNVEKITPIKQPEPLLDNEEHQKKAPGYARPTSSTRMHSPPNANSELLKQKSEEEYQHQQQGGVQLAQLSEPSLDSFTTLSNAEIQPNTLFTTPQENPSLPGANTMTPNLTIQKQETIVQDQTIKREDSEVEISSPSKKLRQETEPAAMKSLSDIWANSLADVLSPTNSSLPINTSGLFGNGGLVDPLSAVWLSGGAKKDMDQNDDKMKQTENWNTFMGSIGADAPTNRYTTPIQPTDKFSPKNEWTKPTQPSSYSTLSDNIWNFDSSGTSLWNTTGSVPNMDANLQKDHGHPPGFGEMDYKRSSAVNRGMDYNVPKTTMSWDDSMVNQAVKTQASVNQGYDSNRLFQQIASQLGDVEQEKLRQMKMSMQTTTSYSFANGPSYIQPASTQAHTNNQMVNNFMDFKDPSARMPHQTTQSTNPIINSYLNSMQMAHTMDDERSRQFSNIPANQTSAFNRVPGYGYNFGQTNPNPAFGSTQNMTSQNRQPGPGGYNFENTTRPTSTLGNTQSANSSVINSYLNSMQAPSNNFDMSMFNFTRQNSHGQFNPANTSNMSSNSQLFNDQMRMNMYSNHPSGFPSQSGQYARPASANSTPINYGQPGSGMTNNQSQNYYMFRGTN